MAASCWWARAVNNLRFLIGAIAAALLLPNGTTIEQRHADRIAEQQATVG